MMFLTNEGLLFLKNCESCKLEAYADIGGIPTIGYGTTLYPTGIRVKFGDKINQEQADIAFRFDVNKLGKVLSNLITTPLNDNQQTALMSLVYNIGVTAFKTSTLRKLLSDSQTAFSGELIKEQWFKWNKYHIDGKLKISKGLRTRRQKEWDLWIQ